MLIKTGLNNALLPHCLMLSTMGFFSIFLRSILEREATEQEPGSCANALSVLRDVQKQKENLEWNLLALSRRHDEQHLYNLVEDDEYVIYMYILGSPISSFLLLPPPLSGRVRTPPGIPGQTGFFLLLKNP